MTPDPLAIAATSNPQNGDAPWIGRTVTGGSPATDHRRAFPWNCASGLDRLRWTPSRSAFKLVLTTPLRS
jgi:hypothetical protein